MAGGSINSTTLSGETIIGGDFIPRERAAKPSSLDFNNESQEEALWEG